MKISNMTAPLEERFGAVAAVRMNCEAGFEAIDYTMYHYDQPVFGENRAQMIRDMKACADSYGVAFNQAHAPFPHVKFGEQYEDYNRILHARVLDSIEIAAELGAEQIVIHPIEVPGADEKTMIDYNLDLFGDFVDRAHALGIRIAVENMWGRFAESREKIKPNVASTGAALARMVDAFDDPYVIACLDLGHTGLVGEYCWDAIRALGGRVKALHIHDTDYVSDLHTAPFISKIDYAKVTEALREVGYAGDLTFEAERFYAKMPDEIVPDMLAVLRKIGEYLRKEILK